MLITNVNHVFALGTPQIVSVDPGSPQPVGTSVSVHATVSWDNDFRAIRICFGGTNYCQEQGSPDITRTFDTSGLSAGTYQIIVQVASKSDTSWSNPNSTSTSFELTAALSQSPTDTPIPPSPPKGPSLSTFDVNPSSAIVGDQISIHIVVNSSNPGATKLNVSCGGVSKNETSEIDFTSTWNTSGCPSGIATVTSISRDVNDPNWTNPYTLTRTITLSAVQVPNPVPSANFNADSTNIMSGQCTYLHWSTSNTTGVDIDGTTVDNSGSTQVCPTVTKKYTLTAHGAGGDANRNITIIVTAQPLAPAVVDSFRTGDIINIGGNIQVIISGIRRLIPNPDTLDALGISRRQIDNRGFSDFDLNTIPKGSNIPDVDRDYSGFIDFKNSYFPNSIPIIPFLPTGTPLSPVNPKCQITSFSTSPTSPQTPGTLISISANGTCDTSVRAMRIKIDGENIYEIGAPSLTTTWKTPSAEGSHTIRVEVAGRDDNDWAYAGGQSIEFIVSKSLVYPLPSETPIVTPTSMPWFCQIPLLGIYFCPPPVKSASVTNKDCHPQCVELARDERLDSIIWIPPSPTITTAKDFYEAALQSKPFDWVSQKMIVRVRDLENPSDQIQAGDLVYWPQGCGYVSFSGGHIGYVTSYQDGHLMIEDANWDNNCGTRREEIKLLDCMRFITSPQPINTQSIIPSPDLSLPSESDASASLKHGFLDWINAIISKLNQPIH